MNKECIITVSALALIGSIAVAAPPYKFSPTFTDNGTTMSVAGSLAGLGGGDYEITLSATGTETLVCADSGGMDPPPKPIVMTGASVVTVPPGGNVAAAFELTSLAPPAGACMASEADPIAQQHDVAFTKASIEIRPVQADPMLPPPKAVRCMQCSFNQPTVDGPAVPLSCFTMFSC